jgi:two-component system sensor histidine kinase DesK
MPGNAIQRTGKKGAQLMRTRDENAWRTQGNTREAGIETNDEVMRESGVPFLLWQLYHHFWLLICLYFPLAALVSKPHTWLHLTEGSLALLFFAISYTWIMWPHPANWGVRTRSRPRLSLLLLVALALQVTAFSLLDDPSFLWLFLGVSAIAGVVLPMRPAWVVVVLLTALPLFIMLFTHGGVAGIDWWWLIALMLLVRGLGIDMIGVARLGSAIRELHTARRELARLAVIEERERLARDLHDLLGQTLSVISLKSELASCLIEEDPRRCAQELSEIEHVSRKMLREVREAVAGYRQPTLICELEGARQLLEAAGIEAQIESLQSPLPPALDAALAWTVREGVTNMIRHSRAQQCCIHLTYKTGKVGAEILNDGCERRQEEPSARHGSGLAGLRERVSALGGDLEAGPLLLSGQEHFCLSVELPVGKRREADASQEEGL